MNFLTAYAFLKQGCKIRRPGWVGVLGIDKNNKPILEMILQSLVTSLM